jgi:hypothetical protein
MLSGAGVGGYALTPSATRIFLGGGGGAGQQSNVLQGGGGVGGGIIVIRASQIAVSGADRQIVANGQIGSFSSGGDGSGGGGGGGSVYLNVANATVPGGFNLTVRAEGGQGGRVNNANPDACHGPGGGGGGGVVRISAPPSANVIVQRSGGQPGNYDNGATCEQNLGLPGADGVTEIDPFLNDSPCALTLLPVEMLAFWAQADAENGRVNLFWATAQETNSQQFVVERSADGQLFEPIGQVAAAGRATRRTDYQFTDGQPLGGTSHYRLRQVDTDGTFAYSKIVAVYLAEQEAKFRVFPNPANDQLTVRLGQVAKGTVVLRLTNLLGKEIYRQTFQSDGSYQAEEVIQIGHLASGQYLLIANTPQGQWFHQKINKK